VAASVPLYLSVAEDGTLLRSTRGSCAQGVAPVAEVSTDGGETFDKIRFDTDLTEVLRVHADAADDLWLVGANTDCELGVAAGNVSGAWDFLPGTSGVWHLQSNPDRARVHSPSGAVDTPCVPVSLSTVDGGPRLLCASGVIIGTADEGLSWFDVGRLKGAVAVRFTSPDVGYALGPRGRCAAAAMVTADGGATWDRLRCLGDGSPRSIAADAQVVIAQVADRVYLGEKTGTNWSSF